MDMFDSENNDPQEISNAITNDFLGLIGQCKAPSPFIQGRTKQRPKKDVAPTWFDNCEKSLKDVEINLDELDFDF